MGCIAGRWTEGGVAMGVLLPPLESLGMGFSLDFFSFPWFCLGVGKRGHGRNGMMVPPGG